MQSKRVKLNKKDAGEMLTYFKDGSHPHAIISHLAKRKKADSDELCDAIQSKSKIKRSRKIAMYNAIKRINDKLIEENKPFFISGSVIASEERYKKRSYSFYKSV